MKTGTSTATNKCLSPSDDTTCCGASPRFHHPCQIAPCLPHLFKNATASSSKNSRDHQNVILEDLGMDGKFCGFILLCCSDVGTIALGIDGPHAIPHPKIVAAPIVHHAFAPLRVVERFAGSERWLGDRHRHVSRQIYRVCPVVSPIRVMPDSRSPRRPICVGEAGNSTVRGAGVTRNRPKNREIGPSLAKFPGNSPNSTRSRVAFFAEQNFNHHVHFVGRAVFSP
jgi:hypothetical protein